MELIIRCERCGYELDGRVQYNQVLIDQCPICIKSKDVIIKDQVKRVQELVKLKHQHQDTIIEQSKSLNEMHDTITGLLKEINEYKQMVNLKDDHIEHFKELSRLPALRYEDALIKIDRLEKKLKDCEYNLNYWYERTCELECIEAHRNKEKTD